MAVEVLMWSRREPLVRTSLYTPHWLIWRNGPEHIWRSGLWAQLADICYLWRFGTRM